VPLLVVRENGSVPLIPKALYTSAGARRRQILQESFVERMRAALKMKQSFVPMDQQCHLIPAPTAMNSSRALSSHAATPMKNQDYSIVMKAMRAVPMERGLVVALMTSKPSTVATRRPPALFLRLANAAIPTRNQNALAPCVVKTVAGHALPQMMKENCTTSAVMKTKN